MIDDDSDVIDEERLYQRMRRHYCSVCQSTGGHTILCPERTNDDDESPED